MDPRSANGNGEIPEVQIQDITKANSVGEAMGYIGGALKLIAQEVRHARIETRMCLSAIDVLSADFQALRTETRGARLRAEQAVDKAHQTATLASVFVLEADDLNRRIDVLSKLIALLGKQAGLTNDDLDEMIMPSLRRPAQSPLRASDSEPPRG